MENEKLQYGDIVEVTIELTGFEGKSVARHNGLVIFVEGAVAGDSVKAKILKSKKKYAEAKVVEVITPSQQRITPHCQYFGTCGGCKWQHVEYAAQLQYKHQHVVDAMERIGGLKDVNVLPIIGSGEQYFYRNKLEFSFGGTPWLTEKDKAHVILSEAKNLNSETAIDSSVTSFPQNDKPLVLGFHVPQRWDKVLDVHECFLQSEVSNGILNAVREFALAKKIPAYSQETETGYFRNLVVREGKHTGDMMVNVVTFEDSPEIMSMLTKELTASFPEITTVINNVTKKKSQVAVGEYEKVYYGEGIIHDKIGNKLFQISANSFFQTNTKQAEKLYSIAKEFAELKSTDVVYDLYCGTGSIALYISDVVKQVIGIELIESSILNARMNAQLNTVENCEFICGDLKDLLTKDVAWKERFAHPDVIIVDPPRSGMHPKAVEELGKMKVPAIVYVSCNPATLARDIQLLTKDGYRAEKIQPVDMFPHTYHIECVAKLSLH
ncbi:MAG: 23S rRNA (uracil(1939)-C(5))-methyltransferase RlmD [Bacteroidota bacterium]|nr:23S rRNA (uracil(1939)-C(5))-methyltransferase RlmD [Bacteroidota bacterium]